MKRLFSLLLILTLLLSVCSVSAFAVEGYDDNPEQPEYLYREKLIGYICGTWDKSRADVENNLLYYDELLTHTDAEDQPDWALIRAFSNCPPSNIKFGVNIGSRSIYVLGGCGMFPISGYAVYDVRNDTFFDLGEYERFEGLSDVVEELGLGNPLGDTDFDGKLTVIDATRIQKLLSGIISFERDNENSDLVFDSVQRSEKTWYLSDFDRDGVRTVLDATYIQKYLAGIE